LLLSGVDDVRGLATKSFERGVKVIERQLQNLIENKPVDMESVRLIAAALINCLLVNKSLLMIMTSMKLNNEEDYLHNLIVCVFTMLQAEMLGLDRKYFVDIASASLLHNIGKLYSDKKIDLAQLQKKDHTVIDKIIRDGVKILLNTDAITPLAPLAAMEYPIPYNKAKTGNPIYNKGLNLVSMMITISSYYDKLRSSPEFQVNEGLEKIYVKMQSMSEKAFHPDLLGNFFNVVGIFPPGTLVELDNGEVCVVIRTNMIDLYRPTVEVIYDSSGNKYAESRTLNLLERDQQGNFPREIRRSLAPDAYEIPETVGN
jgi:HD-GYP domain-containing protein (c-di-GMP phosphodiesterase class II)